MYPTDLTDSQWQVIQELLADQRKRKHDLRNVFNALFFVVKGGIPWRQMPNDLPPRKTACYYFRRFQKSGMWTELKTPYGRKFVRKQAEN